jgi:hypothetical protein
VLEGLEKGRGSGLGGAQDANPGDLSRRLRVHAERHGEEAQGKDDDAPDSAEPHCGLLTSVQVSLGYRDCI